VPAEDGLAEVAVALIESSRDKQPEANFPEQDLCRRKPKGNKAGGLGTPP
jgi:hypothetical protein